MKNYSQKASNIEQAVAYFDSMDTLTPRIKLANDRYKKSKWRKRFVSAALRKKKQESTYKFITICQKFDVPFKKLNQVIFGNYSETIKHRGE